ncbi:MAG TPA: hypothetical protein VFD32_02810 [Dehalococcoidia bacterium]|nr:hypothetical protein [Dehalococcoidia bacterium]
MISTEPEQRVEATGRPPLLVQTLASVGGGVLFALALIAAQRGAVRPATPRSVEPAADAAQFQPAPSATPTAPPAPQSAAPAATVYLVASDAQAAIVQQSWDEAQAQRWQLSGTPPDEIVILVIPEGKPQTALAKVFLAGYLGTATTVVDLRTP